MCLLEEGIQFNFHDDTGRTNLYSNRYFRDITLNVHEGIMDPTDFDKNRLNDVENTHFYFDWYWDCTNNVYFIDYPDDINPDILRCYIFKRHDNDINKFLEHQKLLIPKILHNKINVRNAIDAINVLWIKNLKEWRQNSRLTPIHMRDFFDIHKFKSIVEELSHKKISNTALFNDTYSKWVEKNHKLKELFR